MARFGGDLVHALSSPGPGPRLHLLVCPGDFVASDAVIAAVWPAEAVDAACAAAIRRSVDVRNQRDTVQDGGFGVRQRADIALKALSPGINDPTTAVTCIDDLQAVLTRLAGQDLPATARRAVDSPVVVVARQRAVAEYLEMMVEIGRYATTNARVADAVFAALARIATAAAHGPAVDRLAFVEEVAATVANPAIEQAHTDHDRAQLGAALRRVRA